MTATPEIKAIETSYAGCRFRSRLEARWAVFFDHLGVDWQYEPQGYIVGPYDEYAYLPDFWLPGPQLWAEVKGRLTHEDLKTLIWAASPAGLPKNPNGDRFRPGDEYFYHPRILILGDVPAPGVGHTHSRIDTISGLIMRTDAFFAPTYYTEEELRAGRIGWTAQAIGEPTSLTQHAVTEASPDEVRERYVGGRPCRELQPWPQVNDAYRAARSARFEHGERGPMP